MLDYIVVFSCPYGAFLKLEMQLHAKHKGADDFDADIAHIAKKLGVVYLYKELKE